MAETDNRDYLTGLYNRKGITEQCEALPKGKKVHVMFCDLDNFKSVNDIYGHASGDSLLIAVANMLQERAPEAIAGRLAGDEFILTFVGDKTREELAEIADSIIQGVRDNRKKLQFMTMVSISIGIVWNESADSDLGQILHKSDAAMYQAKQRGKSCYVFYDDLEEQIQLERAMENQVMGALQNGRFQIRFLPVNNIQSSRLEQTELFVCWERDDGGYWSQEQFWPVLERNGFIREIDDYVIRELCRRMQAMQFHSKEHGKISIQLSRLTFLEDGLADRLLEILNQFDVFPDDIEIGIKENVFGHRDSEQIIRTMQKLKEKGFSLALFGFGENFSSFRYLRQLPVDTIHFDVAYFKENMKTNRGRQIIKTMIRLGKDLKQLMVADGVTEQEEIIFLMGCGCDAAGGAYYSGLLEEADFVEYIKERIKHSEQQIVYPFKNDLKCLEGEFGGEIHGKGIRFIDGISDNWGGIYFPGGHVGENVITFPGQLFSGNSYTISLWIKPDAAWCWASVVYVQYLGGFASIVPLASEGISIFRICEEEDLNGWHDILCHCPDLYKWTFLTVTYDALSESTRYYFNGKKAGYQVNVPIMYACRGVTLGGDIFQKSFIGSVSAFMVFDRAKTEEEVMELYNSFLTEPGFRG